MIALGRSRGAGGAVSYLVSPPDAVSRVFGLLGVFGQCLFVFQAAFVKSRKSRSTLFGARYPRAE